MKLHELGMLVLLGAVWGASFLFIRESAHALGPFLLMLCRVLLAGTALLVYVRFTGYRLDFGGKWKQFLVLGLISTSLPFSLIAISELNLSASLAAILNSTTPLFTAISAAIWMGDTLTKRKLAGVVLGIVGVSVLAGWSPGEMDQTMLLSIGASVMAAVSYGIGGVYAKKNFDGIRPMDMTIGLMFASSVILLVPAGATLPDHMPATGPILAALALAFLSTAFAYQIYFRLLASTGPTKTLSVTFLVPMFGLLWGALFLGEQINAGIIAGLLIILTSVFMVTEVNWRLLLPRPSAQRF